MNILGTLAQSSVERVAKAKQNISLAEIKELAESLSKGEFTFEAALKKSGISVIAECKKASPSKGLISPKFPYLNIAREYENADADAISVLTEPTQFLGADNYLSEIASEVNLPCLRKDFIVDEYMIYEAKVLGAKAYLLITSLLTPQGLEKFIAIGETLGMSALVETRDSDEIDEAINAGARIIGVNNRNLKDFSVDTSLAKRMRDIVPPNILFVAESGIKTADDMRALENAGVDAALIGETLMTAADKTAKLRELRGLL